MTEYIIDFSSIILEASSKEEAYKMAAELISEGGIEVDQIEPN